MRKTFFFGVLMIFALSSTLVSASETAKKATIENAAVLNKTEKKLTAEEIAVLTARVDEIRKIDKSDMTSSEKRELRKEVKSIKENVKKSGEVIYISGSALLLIILIIILI